MNKPMDMDQRIFAARSACVFHTIRRKENSCPVQTKMVITPDEIRNGCCMCQLLIKIPSFRAKAMLTGGEERVGRQIATTTMFANVHTTTIPERASMPWKKS